MIRLLALWLTACGLLWAADSQWSVDFDKTGAEGWYLPLAEDWEMANHGGNRVLRLNKGGPIGSNPRRPVKFALWKAGCVGSFELEVKLRRDEKEGEEDALVVFGYQDKLHFYYAHLSSDDGSVKVHNGLFKVDGSDRARIAGRGSKSALPDDAWHTVRLVRKADSGEIQVFIDGQTEPRFSVTDHSFRYGLVGLGSFNDTAEFDDFRLQGQPSSECQDEPINTLDGE